MSAERKQIDVGDLKRRLEGQWGDAISTLCPELIGPLQKGSKGQPCPKCSGENRFNFDKNFEIEGSCWCRQCDFNCPDGITLIEKFRGWDFLYVISELSSYLGTFPTVNLTFPTVNQVSEMPEVPETLPEQENFVEKAWSKSKENHLRVQLYLEFRGLSGKVPEGIRFHPKLYHRLSETVKVYDPALMAPIYSPEGEMLSIQRIYLDKEGMGKSPNTPNKMIMQTIKGRELKGSAVRLGMTPKSRLCVSEGIETAIAVYEMTKNHPTWAGVTSTLMGSMVVPEQVKSVWIYADQDEAGKEAAVKLATRLTQEGRKAYIIYPSGDGDWLDEYVKLGTDALVKDVKAFKLPKKELPLPKADLPPIKQQDIVEARGFHSYQSQIIDLPTAIISGIVNEEEIIVLSGPPKLGKSLIACNLAMCAALGMDWYDFKVPKPVKVMYLQRELGDAWMQQRSKQIYQGFSNPEYLREIFDRAGVDCPQDVDFTVLEENFRIPEPVHLKLDSDEDMERLIGQLIRGKYRFVIIDPLYCMIKGNENDTQDMSKVLDNLIRLKNEAKVSVLLIHHFGKSTGTAVGGHAHRGSSVIGGGSDGNITFKALEDSLIASNGLDGNPGEYGVLEFEMRNGAPRDGMIMWRNGDHLIWERAKTGVNREKTRDRDGTPIITLMEQVGEPIARSELIQMMLENGWPSETTVTNKIKRMIESRLLFTKKRDDHSTGTILLLPEWREL